MRNLPGSGPTADTVRRRRNVRVRVIAVRGEKDYTACCCRPRPIRSCGLTGRNEGSHDRTVTSTRHRPRARRRSSGPGDGRIRRSVRGLVENRVPTSQRWTSSACISTAFMFCHRGRSSGPGVSGVRVARFWFASGAELLLFSRASRSRSSRACLSQASRSRRSCASCSRASRSRCSRSACSRACLSRSAASAASRPMALP